MPVRRYKIRCKQVLINPNSCCSLDLVLPLSHGFVGVKWKVAFKNVFWLIKFWLALSLEIHISFYFSFTKYLVVNSFTLLYGAGIMYISALSFVTVEIKSTIFVLISAILFYQFRAMPITARTECTELIQYGDRRPLHVSLSLCMITIIYQIGVDNTCMHSNLHWLQQEP